MGCVGGSEDCADPLPAQNVVMPVVPTPAPYVPPPMKYIPEPEPAGDCPNHIMAQWSEGFTSGPLDCKCVCCDGLKCKNVRAPGAKEGCDCTCNVPPGPQGPQGCRVDKVRSVKTVKTVRTV